MEQIGRYRTERVLGSGAFGTVWLAYDDALEAWVAVKVLADNWARDESFRRRFLDEARILWRAESDHLIRVHVVDELPDGRPYFVMDYADRGSLQERMQARFAAGGWYMVEEATAIGRDIAAGLEVVHALGIAHRDLKPSNVMYRSVPAHHAGGDDAERLVLVDFGVARSLAQAAGTTIATGTPHYMAPEQAEGRADHRSDLYSAAVILYELLAGRVPYPYESIGELLRAQAASTFAPLLTIRGDIPPELDATIARGLAPDPDARFRDVGSWAAAIGGDATPPPPAEPPRPADPSQTMGPEELRRAQQAAPPAAPPPAPPPLPPLPAPPPPAGAGGGSRRSSMRLLVGALVVVALLGGVIGLLVATGDDEADGPSAAEVFLEPVSSVGRNPFTEPVTPDRDELSDADSDLGGLDVEIGELVDVALGRLDLPSAGGQGVPVVTGDAPGLYGGTNLLSVCDAEKLVDFLETNLDKARAWAETLGIDVDGIRDYVGDLTDVILRADTRVTNHGFTDGLANPINAVLQAGTAVLVDRSGVPRIRCKCGNPLLEAKPLSRDVEVTGTAWPDFSLDESITVTAADEPVEEFVLRDVIEETPLYRIPAEPATEATTEPQILDIPSATTTTEPTTTTAATTTTVTTPSDPDITPTGGIVASSYYDQPDGTFPPELAVDGDIGSAWFSAGDADGDTSEYNWESPGPVHIARIEVYSNGHNDIEAVREGFGFESLTIEVFDETGATVFIESDIPLPGTPDPDIVVEPDVIGSVVLLTFTGHEDPTCGGFTELRILTA